MVTGMGSVAAVKIPQSETKHLMLKYLNAAVKPFSALGVKMPRHIRKHRVTGPYYQFLNQFYQPKNTKGIRKIIL